MLPLLKTSVDPDVKDRFVGIAKNRRLSEAQLLREIVLKFMGDFGAAPDLIEEPIEAVPPTKVLVSMPPFIKAAAQRRARSKGFTLNFWILALIQSVLMREPVMSHNELAALHASARELAAIGRNINQIAKALNERPGDESIVRKNDLAALLSSIETNRVVIRRLVRLSQQAWGEETI